MDQLKAYVKFIYILGDMAPPLLRPPSKRPYRSFMPSVMTGNVRSLNNKIDELHSLSKFYSDYRQASIISLTETCLTENTHSTYYGLDGFSLYRGDRDINVDKTCGGGV